MANQFNIELDKYLDKKNFPLEEKEKGFKKIINKFPIVKEISYIRKKIKERHEFVDFKDSSSSVHVVENHSFWKTVFNAVSDVLLSKKTKDVDVDIEKSPGNQNKLSGDEDFFSKKKVEFYPKKEKEKLEVEEEPDNFIDNWADNLNRNDRTRNETFSEKETRSAIIEEEKEMLCPPSYNKVMLYKPRLESDVKDVLSTTHKMMKMMPRPVLDDFKKSSDFSKYVEVMRRYGILEKKR
ncbi:MAG: hypothetical protein ACLFPQ_00320 [Candidatus Woesearchaeota archaeon]